MGRAAGDIHTDRDRRISPIVDFWVIDERPPRNRTGTYGDHDFRRRDGVVGLLESEPHILRHGSRNEQPISMPRGRHELNAEAPKIEHNGIEHVDVCLTRITAASADLPEFERAAKETPGLLIERSRELESFPCQHQISTRPGPESVFSRETNRAGGTGLLTVRAEQTAPQIKP